MYLRALQRYTKILKERNRLLKDAAADESARRNMEDTIDLWSAQLAHEGALICRYRTEYVRKVNEAAGVVFEDMTAGREKVCFSYRGTCHFDSEEEYLDVERTEKKLFELLSTSHGREIGAACTLWGPHRDDVSVELGGAPARLFASQGQQRSLSLAMKLAEGEISREVCGEYPVFLFDDVQSELDAHRRDYLTERIRDKQVILTTCEPSEIGRHKNANVMLVKDGQFFPA
jgi:DNA replication and repair protein RecF